MEVRNTLFIAILFAVALQSHGCFWYSYSSYSSWYYESWYDFSWYYSSVSFSYDDYSYQAETDSEGRFTLLYAVETPNRKDYCNWTLDFRRVSFEERQFQSVEGSTFCELRVIAADNLALEFELLHVEESVSRYLFVDLREAQQSVKSQFVALDTNDDNKTYPTICSI